MALSAERKREIGGRIKELRDEGNYSQPHIADAVGVTLRAYQAWEAGDSGITRENVEKLAAFFAVSPEHILSGPAVEEAPDLQAQLALVLERLDWITAALETNGIRPLSAGEVAEGAARRNAARRPAAAEGQRGTRRTSKGA
jgi:transcriptional regulator with XRE-family HTH domain